MTKIESRNLILNDVIVPALDELGFGDTEPEIISMNKSDGYGADITLRLHTETPNVSWLCYAQGQFLDKVLLSCVLTEQIGVKFKILDKAVYSVNTQDLRFVSIKEISADLFRLVGGNVE